MKPSPTGAAAAELQVTDIVTLADDWTLLKRYALRRDGPGDAGSTHLREVVHRGDSAAVLPYSRPRRSVLLISQLRLPVMLAGGDGRLLEAPGGFIDEGETPEEAARREAQEETGFALGRLEPAGSYFPSPTLSTEKCHLFLADVDGMSRRSADVDDSDMLAEPELVELPIEAALGRCGSSICDAKTALLIHALLNGPFRGA